MNIDNENNALSGFQRLSGDFNKGYTKAIQDMMLIFEDINEQLKHHHKSMTYKWAMKLLKCCLENREKLRDDWNGFVRVHGDELEFFHGTQFRDYI